MRANTSASQACGSRSFISAVTIRLYITTARSPPRFEPQNNHDFRPNAMPRTPRSAALFDRQMRPSSRKRVNALQRLSMLASPIARVIKHRPGRGPPAKRLVVTNIDPDPAGVGLAFGQNRDRGSPPSDATPELAP